MGRALVSIVLVASIAAGCGGDGSATTTTRAVATTTTAADTTTTITDDAGTGDGATTAPPPPAEDVGTVVWRGETFEIDEFFLCETVNPAFVGDFNIQFDLPDGTPFGLLGNIDDFSADHQGLILGSFPDEERATDLQLTLEGRVLSGSATTTEGPIEFTFAC